ncbi:MAG: hypothetical protein WBV18_15385 [Methyloceanibacter sp.]|jgi:uncharacterized protein YjeT (DUF2065 family)|uniref:hypothetical protein n=1 Tax=Methyloceanibacter sp. TaxID=1965321 RepID=UPI003C6AC2FF
MDTSLFLAKLIGPIFVIVGIGLLLNGDRYRVVVDEVMASHTLLYVFGAMALTGGLAIVLTHNVWVWNWPVIITIVGWLMIVRGTLRIILPQQVEDLAAKMVSRWSNILQVSGLLVITLGAFLCWKGFL